ncbi:MarC family protein [Gimibacter soli]|uniref:UPF0056 membrane protein n=1 Tax=Gimibacter soli TaxID=3024400 RepID=A0AAE9XU11_9PROT|nr:MarC family protein [Gimibacter soli]WCL54440.1 MarC family protein [Gimibacter soli]
MLDAFVTAFITLFIIVDPVAIAPVFASLTQDAPKDHQRRMAIKGVVVATGILFFFALVGKPFLGAMGISMDGLRVAGGIMLFIIALEMVMEKRFERKEESAHKMEDYFEDISVFPLGLPLLAGPGSIATVMLLMTNVEGDFPGQIMVYLALGLTMLITLGFLFAAGKVMRVLGPSVNGVITRVLGIILAAMAGQFVLDGLKNTFFGA